MHLTLIAIVGIVAIVSLAAFSDRLGLAAPLSLIVTGTALSFVPGIPHIQAQPEWLLAGVLPPLLYSAAVNTATLDFRRDLKAITGLAVVLVVATTLAAGWLFHWLLPQIGWPTAFALGAVVSPTDAVAATSIGRRLGLPARLLTILEGEGLVNDASALVLLRSAIAAMAGAVSWWHIGGSFLYAVAVAIGVGLVVGVLNVRIRALLNDTVLNTAVSFVIPFLAFLPAEEFDASGVLAVVVAGLVTGDLAELHLRAADRIAEEVNWRTLAFLLESAIFLLMGLSLKGLVDQVDDAGLSLVRAVGVGLAACALVVAVRVVFVGPLLAVLRRDRVHAAAAKPRLEKLQDRLDSAVEDGKLGTEKQQGVQKRLTRVGAKIDFHVNQALGWRSGAVLGWSGMRGAITVAAAQTLPAGTPARPQLVLIAFVVAAATLLLQGLTLPALIHALKIPGDDPQQQTEQYGSLFADLSEAGAAALDAAAAESATDPEIVDRVRNDSLIRRARVARADAQGMVEQRDQYIALRLAVLAGERRALLKIKSDGTYTSSVLGQAGHVLDLEEARFEQLRDG